MDELEGTQVPEFKSVPLGQDKHSPAESHVVH